MAHEPIRDPDAARDDRESERSTEGDSRAAEREPAVRQDDALTRAERLPRRGDLEIPPGRDTSI